MGKAWRGPPTCEGPFAFTIVEDLPARAVLTGVVLPRTAPGAQALRCTAVDLFDNSAAVEVPMTVDTLAPVIDGLSVIDSEPGGRPVRLQSTTIPPSSMSRAMPYVSNAFLPVPHL
jgi:hypothetical protein